MSIKGIDNNGVNLYTETNNNTKTALYSDALMSYTSPKTGESVNVYKAENYSTEHPMHKR